MCWIYQVFTILAALLVSESQSSRLWRRSTSDGDSSNVIQDDMCSRLMKKIYHEHVVASSPPEVAGEWVSERCEVRPGPEFLLRRYRFFNNSHFEAHQYYYSDSDCANPLYSIVARGEYNFLQPSWIIPGGTEADYHLNYVTVMPYTGNIAMLLGNKVNRTCPGTVRSPWQPYERYELFNYVEFNDNPNDSGEGYVVVDKDCTSALEFSLHELQLMRVETRQHHLGVHKMLFLGDVHTDRKQRTLHRPTTYQEPLVAVESNGCPVCRNIANSDDFYPPTLHPRHYGQTAASLAGEWFSTRCEARPHGTFLTRHILFNDNNESWEGYYHHFADSSCRETMFSIYVRGVYVTGKQSKLITGAYQYDFKVQRIKVTPKDKRIVATLKDVSEGPCGDQKRWKIGDEQDVTSTKGCAALQVTVPHVEFELVKVDTDHHRELLFLGQRPSNGDSPGSPHTRPTSFQPPMVKCNTDPKDTLSYSAYEKLLPQPQTDDTSAMRPTVVLLVLSLIVLLLN